MNDAVDRQEGRQSSAEQLNATLETAMRNAELRIKLISLAYEAKTIRRIERKITKNARRVRAKYPNGEHRDYPSSSLHHHRTHVVRMEARCSHLAYGFLRGIDYRRMEQKCYTKPDWDKVLSMIKRFGGLDERIAKQRLEGWKA